MEKPKALRNGSLRFKVIRGPKEDQWYWVGEEASNPPKTLWTGWATEEEARNRLLTLLSCQPSPSIQAPPKAVPAWNSRPKAQRVGGVRAKVIRGPNASGDWYWIVEGASKGILWRGWASLEGARAMAQTSDEANPIPVHSGPKDEVKHLIQAWYKAQEERPNFNPDTLATYRRAKDRIEASPIANLKVVSITSAHLEDFRDHQLSNHPSFVVMFDIRRIQSAYKWATDRGILPYKKLVTPKVKMEHTRNHYTPSNGEVILLLESLGGHSWKGAFLRLLWATGARKGELASLQWGDVDFNRNRMKVSGKTGSRYIPLSPSTVSWLEEWKSEGAVFPVSPKSISTWDMRIDCRKAKVPEFTPHGLRRLAVDTLLRDKVDPATVAAITGHSVAVMMQYYRQVTEGDKEAAMVSSSLGVIPASKKVLVYPKK